MKEFRNKQRQQKQLGTVQNGQQSITELNPSPCRCLPQVQISSASSEQYSGTQRVVVPPLTSMSSVSGHCYYCGGVQLIGMFQPQEVDVVQQYSVSGHTFAAAADFDLFNSITDLSQPQTTLKQSKHVCYRLRRVKCDESKPACLRCLNLDLECARRQPTPGPRPLKCRSVQPKNASPSTLVSNTLSGRLFETEQEYQYFDLFSTKTAFEVLPTFDAEALRRILLQACDSEVSVRYAIVALGALAKKSEAAGPSSVSRNACEMRPVLYYQDALLQYSKAIKYIRTAVSSECQNLRTTLLCCFLVTMFEAGLGNDRLVVDQIQTGISLLRDWRSQYADSHKHALGLSSPAPKVIEDDIFRAFSRLEIQTLYTLDERFLGRQACLSKDANSAQQIGDEDFLRSGTQTLQKMPRVFTTFAQARKYLELIMKCAIILHRLNIMVCHRTKNYSVNSPFLRLATVQHPTNAACSSANGSSHTDSLPLPQRLASYQANNISGLSQWSKCFQAFSKGIFEQGRRELSAADTLYLHSKMVHIELVTALSFSQAVFDDFTSEFEDIVTLSQMLLKTNWIHQSATICFTFDLGIILPLWLVGIKCRVKSIRRQVISLLRLHPRREGVWDSKLVTKMIEWIMEVEEEQDQGDTIPVWARTHGILWSFDVEQRTVYLVCQHKRYEWSDEPVTRQTRIAW
ncbi:hypothetical protein V499_05915 [Pseudogymnoascus sp. VKM F-103]|nr:hypothetical protein V499_05915 [Pseudogymnoascus sp. VKM F-103]